MKILKYMRRGRGFLTVLVVVAAAVFFAGVPRLHAEDVEALVKRGLDLRRQGQDSEALAEFQKALQIQPSPRVRAQAALAQQALGLWAPAEENLQEALSAARDPWIRKNYAALSTALSVIQSHLGNLQPWGTPIGASVFVDGKLVGTLPLKKPVRVAGEAILLVARAGGYLETRRFVRVPAGETVREHLELNPVPSPQIAERQNEKVHSGAVVPSASESKPAAAPTPSVADAPSPEAASTTILSDSPNRSQSSTLRPLAWITGVGAVGALTFGIVETMLRARNKEAFNNYAMPNPLDPRAPFKDYCSVSTLPAECQPLKDAFDRSNTLMIVGYVAAGALAAGSTVLFVLSSPSKTDASVAVACFPYGPGLTLGCRLAF